MSRSDPRWLREMMDRSGDLALEHRIASVFVGIAGREDDLLVADFIAFVESALRVEDTIFCMTRERAVVLLMDVDQSRAQEIVERLQRDFAARFPTPVPLVVSLRYHAVRAGVERPSVKQVLPEIFD